MSTDTVIAREGGAERLVFVSADGTWIEPADDVTQVEGLPDRERAVLRGLLREALHNCGGEQQVPSAFPVGDAARVDKLIATMQAHLNRTSDSLNVAIQKLGAKW